MEKSLLNEIQTAFRIAEKNMSAQKIFCRMCPKWEIKQPERCSNTVLEGAKKIYFCTQRCKEKYLRKAQLAPG
jgi:hypothetical protein